MKLKQYFNGGLNALRDLRSSKSIQDFINRRFRDKSRVVLPRSIFKIMSTDSASFYIDDMAHTVEQVYEDYHFEDLRKTDIVLDIGACIGAFSLTVCKRVSKVYAVEPVMTERLKKNIKLNNAKNVEVIECALGEGMLDIIWEGYSKKVKGMTLGDIIKKCGGHIDFLKCDCEGGEWSIRAEDLKGIRRIEIEVHTADSNPNVKHRIKDFENMLNNSGFNYVRKHNNDLLDIISAERVHSNER